jgi:hypothetical protein
MADKRTQPKTRDTHDQTDPQQVRQQNQKEPLSPSVAEEQPDKLVPRGRMPLFGT